MSHEENAAYPVPEALKVKECRMPFIGPLNGENAAYLVPETLKRKNVACLLSDHSRALAQAYVLKRQDDILFKIDRRASGFLS